MLNDTSFKILLRTDKTKKDGSTPIYIRVTKHRKTTFFSVGESCFTQEWDERNSRLWESRPRISEKDKQNFPKEQVAAIIEIYKSAKVNPSARRINAVIEDKFEQIMQAEKDLRTEKQQVSAESIRRKAIDFKKENSSYLNFYHLKMENEIKVELAFNTYRAYQATYNKLLEYNQTYYGKKDLFFEDVTYEYLNTFYLNLLKEGYEAATIKKHVKEIRAIWKKAKKEKLVSNYPFEDLKIKEGDKKYKERLTVIEIKQLINLQLTGGLNDARNVFIFSFLHAGIRISDILKLKWINIADDRIMYGMKKTGETMSIKLHKHGLKIIELYKAGDEKPSDYVFRYLQNGMNESSEKFERQIQSKTAAINNCLKKIAALAGITKNLSTHIARHSFTSAAVNQNINAFDISYSLGHSKVQTSETYAGGKDVARMDRVLTEVGVQFKLSHE